MHSQFEYDLYTPLTAQYSIEDMLIFTFIREISKDERFPYVDNLVQEGIDFTTGIPSSVGVNEAASIQQKNARTMCVRINFKMTK